MKRLIVNADDFGLAPGVNRGILEAHREGIVTSASLLGNGPAFEEAVALALGTPSLGVGVHLNLTRGRPLCPAPAVPSLVRPDGAFGRSPLALACGRVSPADVRREWEAQILRAREAGITPTHLDAEKHVHLLPALLGVALALARDHGIGAVRAAAEPGLLARVAPANPQWYKGLMLSVLGRRARHRVAAAGLKAPDRLLGVRDAGRLDGKRLDALLRGLREGTTELVCHPGYADAGLRAAVSATGGGYLVEARQVELQALADPAARRLAAGLGIALIHYGML